MAKLNTQDTAAHVFDLSEHAGIHDVAGVPAAHVMVIKDGVNSLTDGKFSNFKHEVTSKEMDSKALMYGEVRNKTARHNCMFGPVAQTANYAAGMGTVYAFSDNSTVDSFRHAIAKLLGRDNDLAVAEVNHYFNVAECGIGWHGDSERKVTIGVRIGASEHMPLLFHCHSDGKPVGKTVQIPLEEGDVYAMSELAVGTHWKSKGMHWRHASGYEKYACNPMEAWERKQKAKANRAAKRAREAE
jgi:hypothetical protein